MHVNADMKIIKYAMAPSARDRIYGLPVAQGWRKEIVVLGGFPYLRAMGCPISRFPLDSNFHLQQWVFPPAAVVGSFINFCPVQTLNFLTIHLFPSSFTMMRNFSAQFWLRRSWQPMPIALPSFWNYCYGQLLARQS